MSERAWGFESPLAHGSGRCGRVTAPIPPTFPSRAITVSGTVVIVSGNRRRSRPALVVLVVAGAVTCLALGWWQWERFEAVGGNGQNLGYAFQWPLFAVFFIYAYRRFVQLEDADPAEAEKAADEVREIPADVLPPRPTVDAVAAEDASDDLEILQVQQYNEYLAELAARENDRSTT